MGGRDRRRLQPSERLYFATILPEFCGRNLKIKKEECGILFLYRIEGPRLRHKEEYDDTEE